jgi:hypothetical protein
MAGADGHRLDDCASLHRLVLFCVDEVEHVHQRGALDAVGLRVGRVVVAPVVVVQVAVLVFVVRLVYYALCPIALPVPPGPPLLLGSPLRLVLLLAGVLVQKEDGPVLVSHVGLVRQHELGQHVLVARDGHGVLVLHDGPAVDVEGRHQDVLDVVLGAPARVLGAQPAGAARDGVVAGLCVGRQRAVLRRGAGGRRRRVRGLLHLGGRGGHYGVG